MHRRLILFGFILFCSVSCAGVEVSPRVGRCSEPVAGSDSDTVLDGLVAEVGDRSEFAGGGAQMAVRAGSRIEYFQDYGDSFETWPPEPPAGAIVAMRQVFSEGGWRRCAGRPEVFAERRIGDSLVNVRLVKNSRGVHVGVLISTWDPRLLVLRNVNPLLTTPSDGSVVATSALTARG